MKFGEYEIIERHGIWAIVAMIDERHPGVPLLLVGDDARYFFFSRMLTELSGQGGLKEKIIEWVMKFERSERVRDNRGFYMWLRSSARRPDLVNLSEKPTVDGQKGKGAR